MPQPVIFHHSRPALCGSSGRAWTKAGNWQSVPEENRCKRCSALAAPSSPGTVTITNKDRVIWTGPYAEFQRANLDSLSVSEFCLLEKEGAILIGGGAAPLLMISCDSRTSRLAPEN